VFAPALLVALAAARLGSAAWTAIGAVAVAGFLSLIAETDEYVHAGAMLPGAAVGMLLFAATPVALAAALRADAAPRARRAFWIAAAVAALPSSPLVHWLYVERFGDGAAFLPLVAAGASVAALGFGAARALAGSAAHAAARNAFAAVAAVLLAGALPVQLDVEIASVWLALAALGLAAVAARFDALALARLAVAPALAATALLIVIALAPDHYERSATPVASWISYAHLVPIAALSAGAWLLHRPSLRADLAAALLGFAAVALGFVWINLTILDVYGEPGTRIAFRFVRDQARDLTMSIAWAAYALALLVAGTGLRAGALRWTSLALLLVTIAKVFLFDLGKLDGLHRVASLAGLALSLIAVSLFYQRFVFRRGPEGGEVSGAGL
jgi:hypothetical protein